MKKLLLVLAAAFAMVACQTDLNEVNVAGGEVDVTFEVGAPAARAYSDGTTATVLQYAVYEGEDELTALTHSEKKGNAETINISTTVSMKLVTGNKYTVIFWADNDNAPYTVDFGAKTMTVDYDEVTCNNENLDAFYAIHEFTVTGAQTETIELRRPFAQLNIGTSDYTASTNAGYTPDQSYVKVTNIYNTLNLWSGAVSNEVAAEFAYADIKKDETFPVAGYEYLAMNYLLVNEKETVDVEFAYKETSTGDAKTRVVGSVPVQRNHRTNIYGQLLTSDVEINVEIKPEYEEPAHEADALQIAASVGGKLTLTEDVVLEQPLAITANVILNLNGHTISSSLDKSAGAVLNVAAGTKVELVGGTIKNTTENGGAAIRNNGELVLSGVKIEGAPIGTTGYPDYAVYSVGGSVVVEEGTEIVSDRGAINMQGGADVTINGGKFAVTDAVGSRTLTAHVIYAYGSSSKLTINGGDFAQNIANGGGTSVICPAGATIKIYGGNFYHAPVSDAQSKIFQNYMGYGAPVDVYGGTYNDDSVTKSGNLAAGYKAVEKDGLYYVVANDVTVADTPDEVKNVFANGGTILLSDDIQFDRITSIEPGKEVHMNLNGKTVRVDQNTTSNTLIYVKDGAKLVIDGNGTIDLGAVSTMAVFAPYGELVIENGTFVRDEVTTVTSKTTGLFMGAKTTASNVTINGGYFDAGYYNTDAANVDEILAGTMTLVETADDVAKRGASSDKNKVRVAIKENVSALLNHSGFGEFKVYGGTFVGANPAWGDEGCMLPTTPSYLRPWSYYQGALLAGQEYNENGLVLPNGYTITKAVLEDGRPAYTVNYSK